MINPADETLDSILGGRLKLIQPRRGYRFSIDSILLGRFARARPNARVLELGAGCGVIAIMLATLLEPREMIAIEIDAQLADLIERNAALNQLRDVISARCADLRTTRLAGLGAESFDLVVANPPYRAARAGRASPNPHRRAARSEAGASLADFVKAASRYTRRGGRVAFVMVASRGAELIALMRAYRLEPKRIRTIHPRIDSPASAMLVEARKDAGVELTIGPPLIVYAREGVYSDEARALLESS
jgi:tRNA1Val (adenine37-N6)-methyltransferase